MLDTDRLFDECVSRWGAKEDDPRIELFKKELPLFLNEFEEDDRELMVDLLCKFDYFPHKVINNVLLKDLHKKVTCSFDDFSNLTALYCVVKSENGVMNSSSEFVNEYKYVNNVDLTIEDIDVAAENVEAWKCVEYIVLIDDICGSGKTIKTFLEKRIDIFKGKNVIYAVIAIMDDAYICLNEFASKCPFELRVVCCKSYEKAFRDKYLINERDNYVRIANDVDVAHPMGFKDAESLLAFPRNTPNDTLGIFWSTKNEAHHAIFPRREKSKYNASAMRMRLEQRKMGNYNNLKD